MLRWAFGFFLLTLLAALFGFGNPMTSAEIARVLFFVSFGVFLVTLVVGLAAGKSQARKV